MNDKDWQDLQQELIAQFRLGPFTAHDHDHWRRVEAYGIYLAQANQADLEVVRLFAWIHDSQRFEESHDPEHGQRAADFAERRCSFLEPDRLALLMDACRDHEKGFTSQDATIGACWDADRLDLDRVGRVPDPDYLSTQTGKTLALMRANDRRRLVGVNP
ncbi:MAG: hypothetical protein AB7S38_03260 [Vulcanimicrobiota bacterium]